MLKQHSVIHAYLSINLKQTTLAIKENVIFQVYPSLTDLANITFINFLQYFVVSLFIFLNQHFRKLLS